MNRVLQSFCFIVACVANALHAQSLEPYGLKGKTVTALYFYSGARLLYAATENEGVFRRDLSADSGWVHLNMPAKQLNAIYAFHTYCPLKCWKGVLVGTTRDEAAGDSALIYFYQQSPDTCPQPGAWQASDNGLARAAIQEINALAGSAVCQPIGEEFVTVFAGGREFIGRSRDRGESWQTVWQQPNANILALASHRRSLNEISEESIWAGGYVENGIVRRPFMTYSRDFGESWEDRSPVNFSGEECRALALDQADTNVLFAALSTALIKSKDGGKSWVAANLPDLIVEFNALALNPATSQHVLAGGFLSGQYFLLYESFDGGEQWHTIAPPTTLAGVSSIAFDPARPHDTPMLQTAYIGTRGNGVYRYTFELTSVAETTVHTPNDFYLSPTFPNPSAASTLAQLTLRLHTPSAESAEEVWVRLRNTLGQEIQSWRVRVAGGEQTVRLPLEPAQLNAGVYFIQAAWRAQSVTVKWTVLP